jgi:hypothetical protein
MEGEFEARSYYVKLDYYVMAETCANKGK